MSGEGEGVGAGTMIELAGVRTLVRERGTGGVPLVMLHGVMSDGASWEDVAVPLSRGRRVVTPDMPLHGRSETPLDFRPGPEGMVAWLEVLLDALGAGEADLCGLSMGGSVTLHFALARPERVRRAVLVDAANVVPLDEAYQQFIADMREKMEGAIGVGVVTSTQWWTEELGPEGPRAAAVDPCVDPMVMSILEYLETQGIPFEQVIHGLQLLEPMDQEQLGAIPTPILAVWGADDPFFPADEAARILGEGLPACRIEVMDGVGHNPVKERPERFIQLVEDFLG